MDSSLILSLSQADKNKISKKDAINVDFTSKLSPPIQKYESLTSKKPN